MCSYSDPITESEDNLKTECRLALSRLISKGDTISGPVLASAYIFDGPYQQWDLIVLITFDIYWNFIVAIIKKNKYNYCFRKNIITVLMKVFEKNTLKKDGKLQEKQTINDAGLFINIDKQRVIKIYLLQFFIMC